MEELDLANIVQRLRDGLAAILGDQLHSVWLYGSQARREARPDSDIDVLVVVQEQFDYHDLMRRTLQLVADLSLEYDTVISHAFVTQKQFETETSLFLTNVRREAVPI